MKKNATVSNLLGFKVNKIKISQIILLIKERKIPLSINFWQDYQIRLDHWGMEYDNPINLTIEEDNNNQLIEIMEGNQWQPYQAKIPSSYPDNIIFIDGRRRLDGRFLGRKEDQPLYGAFGTLAVGAVKITNNQASFLPSIIRRVIALGGDVKPPITSISCPFGNNNKLIYDLCLTSSENNPQIPILLLQKAMLENEARLAEMLCNSDNTLIIRDGPLLYGKYQTPENTLGYVKTMGKNYLDPEQTTLLWELKIGQRTPIFAIGKNNQRRLSWYLKSGDSSLSAQRLGYHGLHGIVRLDLDGEVELEKAQEIADLSTNLILKYASHPTRDPRAPQNLTPVGALERELGRRMGDRQIIERRLRSFLLTGNW